MIDPHHIAFYAPSLGGGGAEKVMVTLANGIASLGYRVDFVLAKAEGPYLSDIGRNVRVIDLKTQRVISSLPALAGYLWHQRPASLVSALDHANVVALLAGALTRTKTRMVVSVHNTRPPSFRTRGDARLGVILRLMRWFYPRAHRVVCVSAGAAEALCRAISIPREKISVINNPIDISRIAALANQPLDHPWFVDNAPPVLLAAGRLVPEKDYPTLLRAFAALRQKRNIRLVILGEGPLRSELETLLITLDIAADVQIPGFVENPYSWMRRASVFVLSSTSEGFGNVLVEAMACGTPVVSTDCLGGPTEILDEGKWGRLVTVGDADALTSAMEAALDDPSPPDVIARTKAYSPDLIVASYLEVLCAPKTEVQA